MPKKTKEQKEIENKIKTKTAVKKAQTKKASSTAKKTATKKKTTKSTTSATKKKTTTKKRISKTIAQKKPEILEYYDLPYRYNQTIVKVLAQTPTTLFIYWDISDSDRKNFEKKYGKDFFSTTKPILIVHNDTLGYSFEVEINDFANSWYLHVSDSKCDYHIELGRRPIQKTENLNTDYIYISASNHIESPNDRILLDNHQKMVYFKDVKTGKKEEKTLTSISFIRNMGKIYNIYDLYKAIYKDENLEDISNPSSGRRI